MIFLSSFIFGLIFGSFLNVVIYRLKIPQFRGGTVVNIIFGRSFCPQCKTKLKWYDLIPIFSFLWLRGACRYCQKKISWQYPIVEVFSGLIWILVFSKNFNNFQFSIFNFQSIFNFSAFGGQFLNLLNPLNLLDFFYFIFIFSSLLVIAVYDFKWQIIPDKIVYLAIAAIFVYNAFSAIGGSASGGKSLNIETFKLLNFLNFETFIWPLLTAVIAFLFFFSIFYFSKGRAMGLGDAKLGFLIGLFLGPLHSVVAFALSFIIGAVFGILLIVFKKKSWKSQIAFGPFLVLGTFITFFLSDFFIKLFQP